MKNDDLITVPKVILTDLLHCIIVISQLTKTEMTKEELDRIEYVNKVIEGAHQLFNQIAKKP